jgi:protein-S-isoprenylcysteine O-methyltransferase
MGITQTITGQIITLCWIVFIVYWIVSALKVKRTVERRANWWWRIPPLAVLVIILILEGSRGTLSESVLAILWPFGYANLTVGIIADIITISGLAVAIWSRITLSGNWDFGATIKEDHELIKRGPYSCVRHPIYSGLLLMFLGSVTWYGRVAGFIFIASAFTGYWIKLVSEETLMMELFPNEYPEYKKKVKALIPFVF